MSTDRFDPTMEPYGSVVVAEAVTRVHRRVGREVYALRGVDLTVGSGEMVALRGRSGSGKTTLLNCVGGLDRATGGTIQVLGTDVTALNPRSGATWRRDNVAFVFQAHALVPHLSAIENVDLALRLRRVPAERRLDLARLALDRVGLTEWADHRPAELSGGQQQRVAVARAVADPPRLLIADEPTSELDVDTGLEVMSLLRRITDDHGTSTLVATHDPRMADTADRTVRLADGKEISP